MERKWWTLVTVCIGTFMLLLDVTIVNVALPKVQAGLGSSFTDLQWVIDAYAVTLAALLLKVTSIHSSRHVVSEIRSRERSTSPRARRLLVGDRRVGHLAASDGDLSGPLAS